MYLGMDQIIVEDNPQMIWSAQAALREKCPYLEFFWSAFSRIRTEYGPEKRRIRTLFTQWWTKTQYFCKV